MKLERSGYQQLPEGDVTVKITKVEQLPPVNPKKIKVTMKTADGIEKVNPYDLTNPNGKGAYYYLTNAFGIDCYNDHDPNKMVGRFCTVTVEYRQKESAKYPGRMNTYDNITKVVGETDGFTEDDTDAEDDEF